MIISHKHKFIFIKNRKTAGTSIEISLSKFCGPKDVITPITIEDERIRNALGFPGSQNYFYPKREWSANHWWNYLKEGEKTKKFYHHITPEEIAKLVPKKVWDSYFKFTFERNPFDKAVSYFFWRKAYEKYTNIYDFILDGGLDPLKSYGLYSSDGGPVVDKVYKFEDLSFFEKDISEKLNFPEPFQLIKYKAKSTSRKVRDYRDILDDKSIEFIKVAFEKEIELFGYEF